MTADVRQLIKEVLKKGYLMSLATLDEGGVWVADVIYIHDNDFNIYWMSDPSVRHSQAIIKNNRVAGTITVSGVKEDNMGIQFEGIGEKIDGDRYDLALKHYKKRKKPAPKENEDVLQGDSWYVLKPKKIQLIYEKLFGFEKQDLDMKYI
ncbi:MAG: pyridoxamine 5'-phosphate oxidase family protein [Candidatus Colwellbacteria bacterium]|nr:pyridoxamine 5'-phosphate oxidase family protein [Candidatus Colwellbacteria bacterium]